MSFREAVEAADRDSARWLTRGALALLVLGVAWRVLRYALCFPLWADEAFVCLNLLDHDYAGLTSSLHHFQVAPVLFLWLQLTAYRLLGASEFALRLWPLLAGLASLVLFRRLTRLVLDPLAAALALGLLASSYVCTRYSCEAKPYAFDLLVTLALLLPAVSWLAQPQWRGGLIVLLVLAPLAIALSYPAIFIAATVSLALLPAVWRQRGWAWVLYGGYHFLTGAAFLTGYFLVGRAQLDVASGSVDRFMQEYWAQGFPPAEAAALPHWLFQAHTGAMLGYPFREAAFLIAFLCLVGAWHWARCRRWSLLVLCLMPFVLTFVAAALRRYPYGDHPRLAQHLAPAIGLLAGAGAARLLTALVRSARARVRCGLAVLGLFALVVIGGMLFDLHKPYKSKGDWQARQMVADIAARAEATAGLIASIPSGARRGALEWYLELQGARLVWIDPSEPQDLKTAARDVWYLDLDLGCDPAQQRAFLAPTSQDWTLAGTASYALEPEEHGPRYHPFQLFHWVRAAAAPPSALVTTPLSATGGPGEPLPPGSLTCDRR